MNYLKVSKMESKESKRSMKLTLVAISVIGSIVVSTVVISNYKESRNFNNYDNASFRLTPKDTGSVAKPQSSSISSDMKTDDAHVASISLANKTHSKNIPISTNQTNIMSRSKIQENVALTSFSNQEPISHNEGAPTTDAETEANDVKLVKTVPISTFAADTDDGSYKLFKSNINNGRLLDEDFVRVEEFINAFQYDYDSPTRTSVPFSTEMKIAPSPWSDNHLLLIGVKGYEYTLSTLPAINLTFLVDVSGSMSSELPTIKTGLKMLVNKLRPEDSISLVTYAGSTKVALSNTKVSNKEEIMTAISALSSGGGTNGSAGITLAYNENAKNFKEDGINRIILMSDGDFNVGLRSRTALEELIEEKRKSGVTFSTVGIGGSNYQDQQMEQIANRGNGNYTFLGDINDAREVFADRFIPTLKNVAKDVKYQIEFNEANVKEYRLIGYENRKLKIEDFNNDNVDAGELPSGTTTTAIYEITLSDQEGLFPERRYGDQNKVTLSDEQSDELAYLKIRFKQPNDDISSLLQFNVNKTLLNSELTDDNQFAINTAGFAQIYKNSKYISNDYGYKDVIENMESLSLDSKKQEFLNMIKTTSELKAIDTP
jgi:Ca-activated chloride channel family protein